jgi:NAD(P)H-dependent FMN reductase
MNVLAFGASNSRQSINKQLAGYVASLVPGADVELIDLNDFDSARLCVTNEAINAALIAGARQLSESFS